MQGITAHPCPAAPHSSASCPPCETSRQFTRGTGPRTPGEATPHTQHARDYTTANLISGPKPPGLDPPYGGDRDIAMGERGRGSDV